MPKIWYNILEKAYEFREQHHYYLHLISWIIFDFFFYNFLQPSQGRKQGKNAGYYDRFYVLRDDIHRGHAYDFSDLSHDNYPKNSASQ